MTTHMHACMHACMCHHSMLMPCTDWARLGWAEIKTEATLLQHRADGRSRCLPRGNGRHSRRCSYYCVPETFGGRRGRSRSRALSTSGSDDSFRGAAWPSEASGPTAAPPTACGAAAAGHSFVAHSCADALCAPGVTQLLGDRQWYDPTTKLRCDFGSTAWNGSGNISLKEQRAVALMAPLLYTSADTAAGPA